MEIILGGDLVPTEVNVDLFSTGNVKELLGEQLLEIWNKVDYRIFNLEAPLIETESPIIKNGPALSAPINVIKGITQLNPELVTLANNHILDHGEVGLNSTLNVLEDNNIKYIGAGTNLSEASKPYIIKKNGINIGFYTCAEHEFSIATDKEAGANPFDPLETLDHIVKLKEKCDYVIVLYHGGREQYRFPSPHLQKVCRKMVEKGANLVVCQHSHCIGSVEDYNSSTIVYGQGNFIFNKLDNEYWNTSLLLKLEFQKQMNIEYIPIMKSSKGVQIAEGKIAKEILSDFNNRSKMIKQEGFIEKKYQEIAEKKMYFYLRTLNGQNKWVSRLDRKLLDNKLIDRKLNNVYLSKLQNIIECEAHRELLLRAIKERIELNGK